MWPSAHWFWMEDDFCLFFLNNKSFTNIDSINREWSQAIWVRLLTYCTCGLSKDSFTVVKKLLFRSFLLFIFVCFVSCFHFEIQSSFIPDGPLCQMWISHQFHVFTNTHCLCVRQRLGVTTLCMVHHHKLILRVIKWSQSTQGIAKPALLCAVLAWFPTSSDLLIRLTHCRITEKPVIAYAAPAPTHYIIYFLMKRDLPPLDQLCFLAGGDGGEDRGLTVGGQTVWGWRVCCVMWHHTASSVPSGLVMPELPGDKKKEEKRVSQCSNMRGVGTWTMFFFYLFKDSNNRVVKYSCFLWMNCVTHWSDMLWCISLLL